jgi:hypothetical protein
MMKIKNLTQQEVIDLIRYDPETGECVWNKLDVKWFIRSDGAARKYCDRWNDTHFGKKIVRKSSDGYLEFTFRSLSCKLHRLIWFRQTGEWPEIIDHINGIRNDNRWCNLRNVTTQENCKNQKLRRNNTSGVPGVNKPKGSNLWVVTIGRVNLGLFSSFEEAVAVRKAAEIEYGYHPNNGRK